jgi:hypothetical protein
MSPRLQWMHGKFVLLSDLTKQDTEARTNLVEKCAMALLPDRRHVEAEELVMQVMETRKRTLSDEHPDTLTTMSNSAAVLSHQGKYNSAEDVDRKARTVFTLNGVVHAQNTVGRTFWWIRGWLK